MTAKKIGLTGGLGSGKSTVAGLFSDLGVDTVDADQIARQLTQPGSEEFNEIVSCFGNGILDRHGHINRPLLGEIVFGDAEKLGMLESILHPPIKEVMHNRTGSCAGKYCILEIPLLMETGQHKDMDRVILVTCSQENRIQRLQTGRGLERQYIDKVLSSQMSDDARAEFADDIINNDGALPDLKNKVGSLHLHYLKIFS